jgi:2-amino-4-hydroxy-6-hydroxymethyldihydropteridine diphosphokinase
MSIAENEQSRAFVAIGSNLGDRPALIQSAIESIDRMPRTRVIRISQLHETTPVGPAGQGMYLNGAVELQTNLSPRMLLDQLLEIERLHGRDRTASNRWGPRTLDLDLLLFDDLIVNEPGLTVPHPRLHERLFVLEPLAEIAPGALHPVFDRPVSVLLSQIQAESAAAPACHQQMTGGPVVNNCVPLRS